QRIWVHSTCRVYMRVAVVYPIPFGSEGQFGGGERYAWELARALARRVPTKFVTTGPRRSSRLVDDLRVEIYPFLALVHGHRVNPLSISFIEGLLDADVIHCISYNTLIT